MLLFRKHYICYIGIIGYIGPLARDHLLIIMMTSKLINNMMQIEEDGTLVRGSGGSSSNRGGRMFLGLGSLLTGAKVKALLT